MSEPIDIVAVSDHCGGSRWHAVVPRGPVAGTADLQPIIPFGEDFLPSPVLEPGAAELSLHVEPLWRRRGLGSRLLAAVRGRSAGPRLVAHVAAGSPGEAFCLRHGFWYTGSRRHDRLSYGDVHQAWLGEMVEAEHSGYRLIHWTGDLSSPIPAEELLRRPSRTGNATLTAAKAEGVLAAYALAVVDAPGHPRARQYGPAVLPSHRGRRLGLWVSAALIQRLREVHPHVNEIEIASAKDESHLLALRKHLGFQPFRRTRRYELPYS
ncbi:GNAT family N-acetyltransferase [Nonomuraea sp. LPB2021202275-12-8]|uniref:GNAT family N-acetyltransferase n=1 Tax=Nonomuraea sp. LPB2021202275-12-8 TaxID=3120159 RepID=UPI00300CEF73